MRKVWEWIKARPRWIWGAIVGLFGMAALAMRTSGGPPVVEEPRRTPLPAPPPPVPPVLHEEAGKAAAEAERARVAPAGLDGDAVAEGLARHARKVP